MSNAIVLTREGVTVQKDLVTDGVPMPAVRYAFESERSVPMAVRMSETLPEGVSIADIGFHDDYEREAWRTDGGRRLAFERVIEPGERVITVYFIRDEGIEPAAFEAPPSIDQIHAVDEEVDRAESAPLFRGSTRADGPIEEAMTVETDVSGVEPGAQGVADDGLDLEDPAAGDVTGSGAGAGPVDEDADDDFVEASPDEPLRLNDPALDDEEADEGAWSVDAGEDEFVESSPDEPLELDGPAAGDDGDAGVDSDADADTDADIDLDIEPDIDAEADADGDVDEGRVAGTSTGEEGTTTRVAAREVTFTDADGPPVDGAELETLIDERVGAAIEARLADRVAAVVEREVAETLEERASSFDAIVAETLEGTLEELVAERVEAAIGEAAALREETGVGDGEGHDAGAVTDGVADRLLEELEDEADAGTLEALRSALDVSPPNHLKARIERAEGELNELAAYTEALKEFLDERGSARAVLEDVDDRMEDLEEEWSSLSGEHDAVTDRLDDIEDRLSALDRLDGSIDEVRASLDRHERRLDEEGETLEAVADSTDDLASRLEDVETRVDRIGRTADRIIAAFETVAAEAAAPVESALDRDPIDEADAIADGEGAGDVDDESIDED